MHSRFNPGAVSTLLRSHALLALLVGVYAVISFSISQLNPVPVEAGMFIAVMLRFAKMVPQMIALVLIWRLLSLTYVEGSTDRIGDLRREIHGFLTDWTRLGAGLLAAGIMTVMLISFSQLKNMIPHLQPFAWDEFFVELDRILHFGYLPHEWLMPVFGSDLSISFFTGIYNIWLFMMYFCLVIACFMRPDRPERMQFLIAFVLTWAIGGNLVATLFASVGPVYYWPLGLGETYMPLMDHLAAHADTGMLSALNTQGLLWLWYSNDQSMNAISAFPSMHVASTTLMAIFAFRWSRLAGIVLTVFATGIMIGSVLLAWHYAVDGYAGALIALLCWKFAGWLVARPVARPFTLVPT